MGKEDMKCPVGELHLKSWIRWFEVLNKMVREGFTEKVTIFCKQISEGDSHLDV